MRIRDGKNSDPGLKKVVLGVRDKHPGSTKTAFEISNFVDRTGHKVPY
jgi:hypothetical protein